MAWGKRKIKLNPSSPAPAGSEITSNLQQGRSKPNRWWEHLFWVVALILVVMMSIDIVNKEMNIRTLLSEIEVVEQNIELNRIEHERLLQEREFIKQDGYIERAARERLELLKPGDLIFIIDKTR